MLFNLVDNALKYTPRARRPVTVRVAADGAAVALEVEDTGPGVPAEAPAAPLRALLPRRRRALARDPAAPASASSIVKHIAELHHGKVEFTNLPGGGALFTVRLPRLS